MNLGTYEVVGYRHAKPLRAYDYRVTGRPETFEDLVTLMKSFGHSWYYCKPIGPKKYLLDHYDDIRGRRRPVHVIDYGHDEAIRRTVFSFCHDFTQVKGEQTLRRSLFNADVKAIVRNELLRLIARREELSASGAWPSVGAMA